MLRWTTNLRNSHLLPPPFCSTKLGRLRLHHVTSEIPIFLFLHSTRPNFEGNNFFAVLQTYKTLIFILLRSPPLLPEISEEGFARITRATFLNGFGKKRN